MFRPFGDFMQILGGSLFQVLLPLGLMLAFILWKQENFGASVMLWWSGQNFIDISPYILDAPTRNLPLTRGRGPQFHDWGNLLGMTGTLAYAEVLAWLCFGFGALLIILSNLWGAALLLIELKGGRLCSRGLLPQGSQGFRYFTVRVKSAFLRGKSNAPEHTGQITLFYGKPAYTAGQWS